MTASKVHEYIGCDAAWKHGLAALLPGVRVLTSADKPGYFLLQIRVAGVVASARLSPEQVGELHRQAAS